MLTNWTRAICDTLCLRTNKLSLILRSMVKKKKIKKPCFEKLDSEVMELRLQLRISFLSDG